MGVEPSATINFEGHITEINGPFPYGRGTFWKIKIKEFTNEIMFWSREPKFQIGDLVSFTGFKRKMHQGEQQYSATENSIVKVMVPMEIYDANNPDPGLPVRDVGKYPVPSDNIPGLILMLECPHCKKPIKSKLGDILL